MYLLYKCGYSPYYMDSTFKDLGVTSAERSGRVEDWVAKLNIAEASRVIDILLEQAQRKAGGK